MCTASKQIPCKVDGLNCKSPGRETLSTRETITGDLSGKLLTEAGIQQVITFFKRIQYLYSYFSFLVYRIIHTVFANYPLILTTIVAATEFNSLCCQRFGMKEQAELSLWEQASTRISEKDGGFKEQVRSHSSAVN